MQTPVRRRHRPAPLAIQVMYAERQVLERRRQLGERAAELGRGLRRQLTSPLTLLWAGGLGFAFGLFTRHREAAPDNAEQPHGPRTTPFAWALKLIVFGSSLARGIGLANRHVDRQQALDP